MTSPPPCVLTPNSLLSIPEAIAEMRISRSQFFRLKRQGVFRTVQLGHRTLVPHREIIRLIDEALDG